MRWLRQLWQRRMAIALIALAVLALGGLESYRYVRAYQDLRDGKTLLAAGADLVENRGLGITNQDLTEADGDFGGAGHRLDRASGFLDSDPILWVASHLPWLGPQVDAARNLADAGVQSAGIGTQSIEALRTFQRTRDSESGQLSQKVVPELNALQPQVDAIEGALAAVRETRSKIGSDSLLGPLRSAVSQLDDRIANLETHLADYRQASAMAPKLLGYEGPQTYLVLAEDNNEIMATGGFALVYGLLTFDQGRLQSISFDDVAKIGPADWPPTDASNYVAPPAPLRIHLLRGWPMGLAEASWWPDFPTSAQKAIEIYRSTSGSVQQIDGVIGINFLTLEKLLQVLGPITIAKYGETVTADDVNDKTLIITHPESLRPWETDRYDFTGYLAREVLDRTLTAPPDQWAPLLGALGTLGREKNMLLYHTDPAVQQEIADFGWDGGVRQEPGDYLMVVDSNLRRNKLSQVVKPSINLSVSLDAQGDATNVATISYNNDYSAWAQGKDPRLASLVIAGGSLSLYGDYVRLLAPAGSRLAQVAVGGLPVEAEEVSTESSRSVFGCYLSVPIDATQEIAFTYVDPGIVNVSGNPYEYRLRVQKQPGTRAIPLTVTVDVPPGMKVESVVLDGKELEGQPNQIVTDLQDDRQIVVRYAPSG